MNYGEQVLHTMMMQNPRESISLDEIRFFLQRGGASLLESVLVEREAAWKAYTAAHVQKQNALPDAPLAETYRRPSRADIARVIPPVGLGMRALAPTPEPIKRAILTIPVLTEEEKHPGRIAMQLFGPGAKILTELEGITEHELDHWINSIEEPTAPPVAKQVPAATFTLPSIPAAMPPPPPKAAPRPIQLRLI